MDNSNASQKNSSGAVLKWSVGVIIILAFTLGLFYALKPENKIVTSKSQPLSERRQESKTTQNIQTTNQKVSKIDEVEKQKIDNWISKNRLDQYGNPAGTTYEGGSPLKDATTGDQFDRYDYILARHRNRPWNKTI